MRRFFQLIRKAPLDRKMTREELARYLPAGGGRSARIRWLEERDLLRIEPHPDDGRRRLYVLTGYPPRNAPGTELGRLSTDAEGHLLCHVCGVARRHLATHAWRAHGLTADEYRAKFELNRTTPLVSDDSSARYRQTAVEIGLSEMNPDALTPEAAARGRRTEKRLEMRQRHSEILEDLWQDRVERPCPGECGRTVEVPRAWHNRRIYCDACAETRGIARTRRYRQRRRADAGNVDVSDASGENEEE